MTETPTRTQATLLVISTKKSDALGAIIVAAFVVIIVFLFFRLLDSDGKRKKLTAHYHKLKDDVLRPWRNLQKQDEVSPPAGKLFAHLEDAAWIFSGNQWYRWTLDHIQSGYSKLWDIISRLKVLEERHNRLADNLLELTSEEVTRILKSLPTLSAFRSGMLVDYYRGNDLIKAATSPTAVLEIVEGVVVKPNGIKEWVKPRVAADLRLEKDTIARGEMNAILKLKQAVDDVRQNHQAEFDELGSDLLRHRELVNEFERIVDEIAFDIENGNPLKGQCGYERSIGYSWS